MRFVEILFGIVILFNVFLLTMEQPNIEKIYNDYIDEKERLFRQELDKKKDDSKKYYRPSSTGMCSRKIYYETILRADKTNEATPRGKRIMRLGTVIHNELQKAFEFLKKKGSTI